MTPHLTKTNIRPLDVSREERDGFVQVYDSEWPVGIVPAQWNAVRSSAGVLRGVHVHRRHDDYLLLASGRALIGCHDMRERSSTFGLTTQVELTPLSDAITIPHGVAHGFYFLEPSIHLYAVSHTFDPNDELGCRFDDPDLGFSWPVSHPTLSARDAGLGSLASLRDDLRRVV
ncbi:MAG: dTDP-4-dehydrorhamnose 3,5-epimerase family protein [Acidimicrobiales bacterium]|jgi:dTDP-4-dehydrorhamnose 3,5-epimerase|nr:dTDP-4-dehydrorhamnose 3,5-epimerase family protein [Acidimicrobiales bacterium]MDG2218779.1 dTDP-4-dehydrorhamnose 3,5-epimerase family protein [Acidimicrobiales bacterium]